MEGCTTEKLENLDGPPGFYPVVISEMVNAARLACCSKDGSTCSRKLTDDEGTEKCHNHGRRLSWEEANLQCLSHGLRLCKSQEEMNKCCGQKCKGDDKLYWTSIREGNTWLIYIVIKLF